MVSNLSEGSKIRRGLSVISAKYAETAEYGLKIHIYFF